MSHDRLLDGAAPTITVSARRYRFTLPARDPASGSRYLSGSHDASEIARAVIGSEIAECVIAILLDARRRVMGYTEVCRGTLNATRFSARDVLVPALLANAAGVVVAHNHGCVATFAA
jgi:DNA repair protein RadC